jgi:hypothetical protein
MLGTFSFQTETGANPTVVGYNATVENVYNALSSLVRFEKNFALL